jgi:peptide/nickel transport system ATP-binding protein
MTRAPILPSAVRAQALDTGATGSAGAGASGAIGATGASATGAIQAPGPAGTAEAVAAPALLQVDGLRTHFHTRDGVVRAVDGVSFDVRPGETLAIVGESGCGKSVTAMSILRLLPMPPARIAGGRIVFEGRDLLALDEAGMRRVRGNLISMVFQEPMTSLNPVLTIGRQVAEVLVLHRGLSERAALAQAVEGLRRVQIAEPERRVRQYPHELSGGMRQRVMIAMALACGPRLLIADEPTTALDVTIQAQILALMRRLGAETGASIILITHDLGVVAEMAQRVVVMYAGRKVEEAGVQALFAHPRHPYTRGLLGSMPRLRGAGSSAADADLAPPRLVEIPGVVPSLKEAMAGCLFAPRCPSASEVCRREVPPMQPHGPGHQAACWHPIAEPARRPRAAEAGLAA